MQGVPAAAPPPTEAQLRWLDLIPVLVFTILGVILVFAAVVLLARLDRSFARANVETIALSSVLAIYLAFGGGIAVALRRLRSLLRCS